MSKVIWISNYGGERTYEFHRCVIIVAVLSYKQADICFLSRFLRYHHQNIQFAHFSYPKLNPITASMHASSQFLFSLPPSRNIHHMQIAPSLPLPFTIQHSQ